MTKRSPSKSPLANLALVGLLAMPLIACDEPVEQPQQKLAPKIETTDRFHAKTLDEGRKKRRQIYQQMEFELIAETPEVFVAEVPIFESHDEYLSLLVEHGLEEGDPGSGGPGFTLGQQPGGGGGGDWLQPPTASGDYVIYHYTPPNPDPGFGGADGLANVGGGDGGGTVNPTFDPVGGIKGNGGSQVERWALSDGLPLRNQPDTSAGEIMILDRHDRVFVLNTPPIQNDGMVFVEVTVADRFPYPAGWFPLRWLAVGTTTDSSDEIDFAARYGLFGRLAAELFEDRFYGHCNHYPVTPHSVFEWITPTPSYPNTVPPAKRYECGELPVGDIVSASWKDIHTIDYTLPGFDVGVIKMDDIPFAIPIQHSRLGGQTRGTYEVVDLDTGWHNNQPTADLVEHEHFKTMADVDTTESAVRLHDTDVWYNVTWDAPSGVNASHADAFFNVCIQLPGGQLRGETTPHDITISGPFNTSHITGFQWGTFEYDPLEVCATAAIHDDTQGNLEHLTNAPPSPIRVEFVNARLRNVTIRQVQSTKALGSFEGVHSDIKNMLESLLNGVLGNSGVLGLLFDEFLKQGLEERILSVLVEYGASVGSNMPHPVQWTKDACDELMPQYATPASPYFPIYQHCKEASQEATIELFTNAVNYSGSCFTEGEMARANTGKLFSTDDHDEFDYPAEFDGESEWRVIDRPYWVSSCGVEATLETTMMEGYWPLMHCLAEIVEDGVNYRWSDSKTQTELQDECTIPAVGMLCQLYGEGDDLMDMWTAQLGGGAPSVGGAFGFCAWYEDLTAEELPSFTIGD